MNLQGKLNNGKVTGGIEWTKTVNPDGTETRGATSNPVKGCKHRCRWQMPDGTITICYAENVANGVAQSSYPNGFEYHYWQPAELDKWIADKKPKRIFWDSMSDLFGAWVPERQIQVVLDAAREAHWHTFQSLTKNAPRLLKFDLPSNVWPGVSMSPDFIMGRQLSRFQQSQMLERAFTVLAELRARNSKLITWMSFEPISWDVAHIVDRYPGALKWAVIGAASNGRVYYQPEAEHVQNLLDVLDAQGVPVFFKGNLKWQPWREEFPQVHKGA